MILTLQFTYFYTTGKNYYGQLGINGTESYYPSFQPSDYDFGSNLIQVVQGEQHVIALSNDGYLYGWGDNTLHQVSSDKVTQYNIPVKLLDQQDLSFTQVAAGHSHSVALASNGSIYSWGLDIHKQLGTHLPNSQIIDPATYNNESVKSIHVGGNTTFILTDSGNVYFFGQCEQQVCNQTEQVSRNLSQTLYSQNQLSISNITNIFAFNDSLFLIDAQGYVYSGGNNFQNKLCHNTSEEIIQDIRMIQGIKNFDTIVSGSEYTLMKVNGYLYACGNNQYTINESVGTYNVPTYIYITESIIDFAICEYGTVYVTQDDIVSIGSSIFGELGYIGIKKSLFKVGIKNSNKITCRDDYSIVYSFNKSTLNKINPIALGFICFGAFLIALIIVLIIVYVVQKRKRGKLYLYDSHITEPILGSQEV